ncbi:recombinase family protein [Actinophytocola gossypii]|uniref:recombinase family protein n=1 Tax=Actinophytocola gossypii TaxID=2812003 RepID=UPI0021A46B49|nr:recombinase family protein [Actinophytocola gossypii]
MVRRIFSEYLAGLGDRAIANGLNRDRILCPSARRPEQNTHRLADGWQGSTVRSILENPRYTGYAIFGRWTKQETLVDPDDVAAGHVVRFRRSTPDRVVRSRKPSHPKTISVDDFTQAQLLRRSKAADGLRTARKTERSARPVKQHYLFRGRIRCAICRRKMEGSPRKHAMYYRCPARTLAPGFPVLAMHPAAIYLREDTIRDAINEWFAELFHRDHVDKTVAALVASQDGAGQKATGRDAAEHRLAKAEAEIRRFQAAIAAGIDPTALVEAINTAQAERAAAQAEINNTPALNLMEAAEVHARIASLGDVPATLSRGSREKLAELYAGTDLQVLYEPGGSTAEISMRVNSVRVRGGIRTPVRGTSPGFREVAHASTIPAWVRWRRCSGSPGLSRWSEVLVASRGSWLGQGVGLAGHGGDGGGGVDDHHLFGYNCGEHDRRAVFDPAEAPDGAGSLMAPRWSMVC